MKKAKILIFSLIFIIFGGIFQLYNNSYATDELESTTKVVERSSNKKIVSLYCWSIADINLSKLNEQVDYLDINTLYIYVPRKNVPSDTERLKQIMEFAKQNNIDVFLLDGDQDWLTNEANKKYVYNVIDLANELNKELDYKIKGVSLDVEFYNLTSNRAERKELFKTFIKNTVEVTNYANSLGLGYSMALPAWFDEQDMSDELEELMTAAKYDHLLFMNYSRNNAVTKLANEVEMARKYGVTIVSAAEADWVDEAGVGFYDAGIEALQESIRKVEATYNYEGLGIGYHHYRPIIDLMERIHQGIENKYELEISPYLNDKSVKVDSAVITDKNGKEYKPVKGYHSANSENVINFYGLTYGEEYTITVKSGNATATKTFTFTKGDVDKIEIAHDKIELIENDEETEEPEDPKDPENPGESDEPTNPGDENPDDDKKDDEEKQPGENDPDDKEDDEKDPDNKEDEEPGEKDPDNKDDEEPGENNPDDDKKDDEEEQPGDKDDNKEEENPGNKEDEEDPSIGEDKPNEKDPENDPEEDKKDEENPGEVNPEIPEDKPSITEPEEDIPNTYDNIIGSAIIAISSLIFTINVYLLINKQ